jgi:hypothetical protein
MNLCQFEEVIYWPPPFYNTKHFSFSIYIPFALRENENSPSAPGFPECQISGTRVRNSSPSVALGKESLTRVPNSP